jgi:hypothetical protein
MYIKLTSILIYKALLHPLGLIQLLAERKITAQVNTSAFSNWLMKNVMYAKSLCFCCTFHMNCKDL